MSQYARKIETQLMLEDEDHTVLNIEYTGNSIVIDGGDLYLETIMDISDGSKYRTWLALVDGELIWDDTL